MKQVHGEHPFLAVVTEYIGIIAFRGGDALPLLQLLDGGDQIAIPGRALVLFGLGGLLHARLQRSGEIGGTAFEKQLHISHRFLISRRRGQGFDARAQAALDVVLQAGPGMVTREIHFAGRHQKVAVDEIDDAVGEVRGDVRTVVSAAIFTEAACDVHPRKTLAQRQFHVGIGFVIAQQNIEARLTLFDEVVFERQRFLVVGDDDVVDVDRLADQRVRFCVLPTGGTKVARHPAAQVLRLTHVDDIAFGVLVQVHAGLGGQGADFLVEIHAQSAGFILLDDQMTACGTMANGAALTRDSLGNEYGSDVREAIGAQAAGDWVSFDGCSLRRLRNCHLGAIVTGQPVLSSTGGIQTCSGKEPRSPVRCQGKCPSL